MGMEKNMQGGGMNTRLLVWEHIWEMEGGKLQRLLSLFHGHFWFYSVIVHNTYTHAGIQGLNIRSSGAS